MDDAPPGPEPCLAVPQLDHHGVLGVIAEGYQAHGAGIPALTHAGGQAHESRPARHAALRQDEHVFQPGQRRPVPRQVHAGVQQGRYLPGREARLQHPHRTFLPMSNPLGIPE